ncbi:hypothetical protein OS493_027805 [Desmophyllum pertusum]|uniref:Uncharacterized protein n=1 Tax=Desmophyllum pertusum TaxID=174260 RepID=A0A9W9YX52_9CNID|nr:hypothetical protein OS493_027805 [Desmophyllum pertusum]
MEILESDHAELGDSMFNLGMVFEQCSELDKAAYHFQQALTIYTKSYPMSHQLCQSADKGIKRVSQQQADLNNQTRPDHFIAHLWSSMARAFRRSKLWSSMARAFRRSILLKSLFPGAHWERYIQTGSNRGTAFSTFISFNSSLVIFQMVHYVRYLVGDAESIYLSKGVLKAIWLFIPYYTFVLIRTSPELKYCSSMADATKIWC